MRRIILLFWLLVILFVFILCQLFSPLGELLRGKIFLLPFILFCLLGILLCFKLKKSKLDLKLKRFLGLTAFSACSLFIFVVLHNGFYALTMVSANVIVLRYLFEGLQFIFFIAATILCPLGFLIGSIGVIFILFKGRGVDKI